MWQVPVPGLQLSLLFIYTLLNSEKTVHHSWSGSCTFLFWQLPILNIATDPLALYFWHSNSRCSSKFRTWPIHILHLAVPCSLTGSPITDMALLYSEFGGFIFLIQPGLFLFLTQQHLLLHLVAGCKCNSHSWHVFYFWFGSSLSLN